MNSLVQTYQWISIIGYICAVVFLAAAVFLFFYLNIPQVLGYLTKRTERKAVEAIRAETEQRMEKSAQEIVKNRSGTKTDEIPAEKLEWEARNAMMDQNATTLLNGTDATTLLGGTDATMLPGNTQETTVLNGEPYAMAAVAEVVIEEEILWIHTDEIIS